MFGSTNPFGQSSNSPFGSQSIFGQTNNASSNPFAPKPFGSTTPFGSQTGGSIFGGTSTGVFGATQSSAPSTPAFGASPSPAFGSSVPAFGASSSTPAFGSSSSSFGRHLERSRHLPRLLSWCGLQCWKILTKAEGYSCELYCICKMDGDSVSHLLARCLVARKLLSSALLETY